MSEKPQSEPKTLSIVIPIHNEVECCGEMVRRLSHALENIGYEYEILFVDDGSDDGSFDAIALLARENRHLKCLSFSRNMGHQAALACGLEFSRGDAVIMMDGDLQHPPELIPELVRLWHEGFDIVNTVRRSTADVGFWKATASRSFYRIFNSVSDVKITPDSSDFRLLDRRCVNALLAMREHLKFYRGMVDYIGFRQTSVAFDAPPRFAGTRSYTWRKSLKFASSGFFSFSTVALKLPFYLGVLVLAVVITYGILSAILIATGIMKAMPGWTSIIAILLLTFSVHLIFMGIIGYYLAKMFLEIKARPQFFISRSVGLPRDTSHPHA